jgi:hypothetical protein
LVKAKSERKAADFGNLPLIVQNSDDLIKIELVFGLEKHLSRRGMAIIPFLQISRDFPIMQADRIRLSLPARVAVGQR